jgi:hypothetical protein
MPDAVLGQDAVAPASAPAVTPSKSLPALKHVNLDDKYTAASGKIFLSGFQALVRPPMIQQLRDQAACLDTAGCVPGYRGSSKRPWPRSGYVSQNCFPSM